VTVRSVVSPTVAFAGAAAATGALAAGAAGAEARGGGLEALATLGETLGEMLGATLFVEGRSHAAHASKRRTRARIGSAYSAFAPASG
jgi:hypothetical protein